MPLKIHSLLSSYKTVTSTITATNNHEDIDISGAYDCTIGDIAIKAQLLITARRLRTSNANYIEKIKFIK